MTDFFRCCCDPPAEEAIGRHIARRIACNDITAGIAAVVEMLPAAYATTRHLQVIAQRHGKSGLARMLSTKLPNSPGARSGDMGEILGTAYVNSELGYVTGPSRLIGRDHQNLPMRGDDVLGGRLNGNQLELVRVEAKSRKMADESAIAQAREGLQRDDGLASPHSLTQFAERLLHEYEDLSNAITDVMLFDGLRAHHLTHVMFILSGSHPADAIREDLTSYQGEVTQVTVTVVVRFHPSFIHECYSRVVTNAP